MDFTISQSIDLSGVTCPLNFVKTKAALAQIQSGEYLEVLLDEGEPILNVPRSLKDEGHVIVRVTPQDTRFKLIVRKA
ncbi:tRNA methyltransferase [Candidatus Termititenax aidoneus]|uniref:tRNA methyltransferase n=1 Tax=Termititenax aidoneus TaxID=2218524 RepID=A0A388T7W5_TERA1|nr:tRNA methyltransferase [Candidatus Termititenax aidoneus]